MSVAQTSAEQAAGETTSSTPPSSLTSSPGTATAVFHGVFFPIRGLGARLSHPSRGRSAAPCSGEVVPSPAVIIALLGASSPSSTAGRSIYVPIHPGGCGDGLRSRANGIPGSSCESSPAEPCSQCASCVRDRGRRCIVSGSVRTRHPAQSARLNAAASAPLAGVDRLGAVYHDREPSTT